MTATDTPTTLDLANRALAAVQDIAADAQRDPTKWQAAGGATKHQLAALQHAGALATVTIAEQLGVIAQQLTLIADHLADRMVGGIR